MDGDHGINPLICEAHFQIFSMAYATVSLPKALIAFSLACNDELVVLTAKTSERKKRSN